MASSFTSIRDRRIKMPRVLGHYLLYKSSSTARCGPTSVTVHALLVSCSPNCVGMRRSLGSLLGTVTKSVYLSYCFPHRLNNLLDGWEALQTRLETMLNVTYPCYEGSFAA